MLSKAIQLSILYLLLFQKKALGREDIIKELPGGSLKKGMTITVAIILDKDPRYVAINLQEAENMYEEDIGLRITMRFGLNDVVLNSYKNGEPQEEVWGELPYDSSVSKYEVSIAALEDKFLININVMSKFTFPYRTDINKLKYLEVNGDMSVDSIGFD